MKYANRRSIVSKEPALVCAGRKTKFDPERRLGIVRSASLMCDSSHVDAECCLHHCQWEDNGKFDGIFVQHIREALQAIQNISDVPSIQSKDGLRCLYDRSHQQFNVIISQLSLMKI